MKQKAFTLYEALIVLGVTTILLGVSFNLLSFNKNFYKFQESKFTMAEALRLAQDLSFKKIEVNTPVNTSTVCGVGMLLSSSTKDFVLIAYATSNPNCLEIASSTPQEFDFTTKVPRIFVSKTGQIISTSSDPTIFRYSLANLQTITLATDTTSQIQFSTASIMFYYPYGDAIIYKDNTQINFDNNFSIIIKSDNEKATITINKAGQILAQ